MRTRIRRAGVVLSLMILAMLYGMLSYRNQLPPFRLVYFVYSHLIETEEKAPPIDEEIPQEYLETDVASLITIQQPGDVLRLRGDLITFLWGRAGLPASLPSKVLAGVKDDRYADIASLARIDELIVELDFGLESRMYHFIPRTSNDQVVLYHEGHTGDFENGKDQIREFLDRGYAVVGFCMPLFGLNNQPVIDLPRLGRLRLWDHDAMKFLAPEQGHPIQYFLEPVVRVLNYLDKNFEYASVAMIGISGGGWTTTLAAAIDPRIAKSFPVAGSYPIFLRSNSRDEWGDYEQTEPGLYGTVNYLELYVMGAHGAGRKQLQILNKYDSCCFGGNKWQTYRDVVRGRVRDLGAGEFDLFVDDSHQGHLISVMTMNRILDELEGVKRPPQRRE